MYLVIKKGAIVGSFLNKKAVRRFIKVISSNIEGDCAFNYSFYKAKELAVGDFFPEKED